MQKVFYYIIVIHIASWYMELINIVVMSVIEFTPSFKLGQYFIL